ncbi:hypothetical protein HY994_03155 [Candidatus Micrarchaeota archaeon]|nr:hypothetical protein [Candidatus Micrarchaeota archaeon]
MWSLLFPLVWAAGFFGFFKKWFDARLDDLSALGISAAAGFLAFSWVSLAGFWFFGLNEGFWISAVFGIVFLVFSVKRFGGVVPDFRLIWRDHKLFCIFLVLAGLGFLYLSWTHFAQVQPDGWYSSGNTWGDLPFHLGVVDYFLHGQSFPPRYVVFDSVLGYPFLADFSSAALASGTVLASGTFSASGTAVGFGASLQAVLVFSALWWFLSFLVLSYAVGLKLGVSKGSAVLALVLLLLSGGLGFVDFFGNAANGGAGIFGGIASALMAQDYTILQPTGWTNVLTSLFLPQRTLLMGAMVIASVFLLLLSATRRNDLLLAGVLAGLMPLVHWHSYLVVMGVAAVYAVLAWKNGTRAESVFEKEKLEKTVASRPSGWSIWLWFFVPAVLLALPQVAWSLQQLSPASLIHFQPNWVANSLDPFNAASFWLSQTGIWLLAVVFALWAATSEQRRRFLPFGLLFMFAAFVNVQPYAYDNLKFFFFVQWAASFLLAAALVALWKNGFHFILHEKGDRHANGSFGGVWSKVFVGLIVVLLVFSGALSIGREANLHWRLYDVNDLQLADWTGANTSAFSVFLTSTAHNHPVSSLAGRSVVMGYPGWLWSHGFNYGSVQSDARSMFGGNAAAAMLMARYHVAYVVVDAKARQDYAVNDSFLSKFPVAFENAAYRVYAVP